MGSSTENSAFKTTRNPWDTTRVPGGSPAGPRRRWRRECAAHRLAPTPAARSASPRRSAASSVSSPLMAGSSRYGLVAFASSLDQIGPFGWTVGDVAAIMHVISGTRSERFHLSTRSSRPIIWRRSISRSRACASASPRSTRWRTAWTRRCNRGGQHRGPEVPRHGRRDRGRHRSPTPNTASRPTTSSHPAKPPATSPATTAFITAIARMSRSRTSSSC